MYKGASESMNRIARTGSSSTVEHGSGRIDAIPAWAKEPEEYYRTVLARHESLQQQMYDARENHNRLVQALKQTLPLQTFKRLEAEMLEAKTLRLTLETEAASYRAVTRAPAVNAWGAVYYYCAQQLLDQETRRKLDDNVQEFLRRTPTDGIKPPRTELTQVQKDNDHRKKKLRERRNNFREFTGRDPSEKLVWSDERGGRTDGQGNGSRKAQG